MKLPACPAIGENINIAARTLGGSEVRVSISSTDTVLNLKKKLLTEMKIPQLASLSQESQASRLSLIFAGAPLKSAADVLPLVTVGLESGSVVTVVLLSEDDAGEAENVSAFDLLEINSTGLFDSPRAAE